MLERLPFKNNVYINGIKKQQSNIITLGTHGINETSIVSGFLKRFVCENLNKKVYFDIK